MTDTIIDFYTQGQADTLLNAKADKASLGDASTHPAADFATSAQGAKADTAVQPGVLGTAAAHSASDFATASQGAKADTAVQPGAIGSAASHAATDFATASQGSKADTAVQPTVVSAKGDLMIGTAAGAVGRLPVGADGTQIFADSSKASGLRFGLAGEMPRSLGIGVDLNTVTTPGFYFAGGSVPNSPIPGVAGMIQVQVRDTLNTNLTQYWNSTVTVPRMFFRVSSSGGASWGSWVEIRTDQPVPGNTMSGVGSPEGIVTASVGTKYVDTAITNGARQWIKATGVGNTGWKVSDGDTGWRDVTSLLVNGWSGKLYLRRDRATIHIQFQLDASAATGPQFLVAAPAGFGPSGLASRMIGYTLAPAPVIYRGNSLQALTLPSYPTAVTLYGEHAALTTDAWPTVLPGITV